MTDEIHALLDDITNILAQMTPEERIAQFRRMQYPHPIHFVS